MSAKRKNNELKNLKPGTYVLATKWHDGHPCDQWAVGFFHEVLGERYMVVDANGLQLRYNGFRRVKAISRRRGAWLLAHAQEISAHTRSLWGWLRAPMVNRKAYTHSRTGTKSPRKNDELWLSIKALEVGESIHVGVYNSNLRNGVVIAKVLLGREYTTVRDGNGCCITRVE